jgi:uncharacterized protein YwgA
MEHEFTIPWRRYALIPELVKRLSDVSPQLGKTVLQKMVFLLQAAYDLDCGYDFTMYSYGPFDSQLLGDLDLVESWGCVKVERIKSGGFRIVPTAETDKVRNRAADFLDSEDVKNAFEALAKDYGGKSAGELELRTTLIYVDKHWRSGDELPWHNGSAFPTRNELQNIVHEIKPKFSNADMNSAVIELLKLGHICLADDAPGKESLPFEKNMG